SEDCNGMRTRRCGENSKRGCVGSQHYFFDADARLDHARKYGTNNQNCDGRRNDPTGSANAHEFYVGPVKTAKLPNYAELQRQKEAIPFGSSRKFVGFADGLCSFPSCSFMLSLAAPISQSQHIGNEGEIERCGAEKVNW